MKKERNYAASILVIGSTIATFFFLSYFLGFVYAIIFLTGLWIHELGHAFAAKAYDADVSMKWITPFGAYVRVATSLESKQKVVTALAGPFSSLVFIIYLCICYALIPNMQLFSAIVSLLLINAVNLLPVYPFDGGVIAQEISWLFSLLLVLAIGLASYVTQHYEFCIFIFYIVFHVIFMKKKKKSLLRLIEEPYCKTVWGLLYSLLLCITYGMIGYIWYMHQDICIQVLHSLSF